MTQKTISFTVQIGNEPHSSQFQEEKNAQLAKNFTPQTLISTLKASFPAIIVFTLALTMRVLYNITIARDYDPIYDAALYHLLGTHMITENCYCIYGHYVTVSRAPLWPFILTGIYFFTGPHDFYARLFYSVLGSGTCVIIYYWARDLFGRRIGLLTGMLASIYICLIIYDGTLLTESLYTFCLTAFTYSLYRLQKKPVRLKQMEKQGSRASFVSWLRATLLHPWVILCGLFLALATLTRPNGISLLAILFVWATILTLKKMLSWPSAISIFCVVIMIVAILVAPWTYRNYQVTHRFVFVSTGMGEVLTGAYNDNVLRGDPSRRGIWNPPPNTMIHDLPGFTPATDSAETATALNWIRTHPSEIPIIWGLHFVNMWQPYSREFGALPFEEHPERLSSKIITEDLIPGMAFPIFLLAFLGLLIVWFKRKEQFFIVYLIIIYTIALNVFFYANWRFRVPIEPLLILCAGAFIWAIQRQIERLKYRYTFTSRKINNPNRA